jgi:hypothetical protein
MKAITALTLALSVFLAGAALADDDGRPGDCMQVNALAAGNPGRDPGNLTTIFTGGNGYAGNMFDIEPALDLEIDAIDVNVDALGAVVYIDVYWKDGTCVGFESSPSSWTLLGSFSGTGAGTNVPTYIDMTGNGKTFLAGQTYGLYVDLVNYSTAPNLNYTNGTPTVYSNAHLTLTTHCGKGTPAFTGSTFLDRIWNGTVYYNTLGLDLPRVDIKCNGEDSGVVVPSGVNSRLDFSLHTGLGMGKPAEIWVVMQTPFGLYSYDSIGPHYGWNPGIANVYYSGPLFDLTDTALDDVLPPGSYQAHVGLDKNVNGVLDMNAVYTYDSVDFVVN